MENYEWAKEMNCAVTVCDAEGIIIYMNDKSRETYKKEGDLIGKNLYECHSERSKEIIRRLLATGGSNAYTIEKHGVHKVIYQTAWKKDGKVAGIVEIEPRQKLVPPEAWGTRYPHVRYPDNPCPSRIPAPRAGRLAHEPLPTIRVLDPRIRRILPVRMPCFCDTWP